MGDLCVIFDMDGTLVDSEGLCSQAFLDLLPQLDIPLEVLVQRFRGRKMALALAEIETLLGVSLPPDFEQQARAQVAALFATRLLPMPGVAAMLQQLTFAHCIASSGPVAKIRDGLTVTGLLPYFEGRIFSAYEVGSWKPDPGLFLHAARAMGVAPSHCVVIEDSVVGIEAAQAAGMFALQFLPHAEQVSCPAAHADAHPHAITFHSMSDLPALLNQRAVFLREEDPG